MSTVGTLAAGAMANLIHRAASVALKERRKLVLVPRETPLSSIHLRGLATLHEAGAVILLAAPGFYHGAKTIEDLVDFIVARALDQIGIDNTLMPRWGQREAARERTRAAPRSPRASATDVRPDRPGLRRDEPRDDGGARPPLAPADGRGRRPARVPGARRLLRHGRPCDRGRARGRDRHRPRLLRRDARRARGASRARSSGCRATCSRCPSPTAASTPRRSASASATSPTCAPGCSSCGACCGPGGRLAILEITQPRGALKPFFSLWFDRIVPLLGRVLPGGKAYTYLPASVRRFPGRGGARGLIDDVGLRGDALPALRRLDRRPAHGDGTMSATLEAVRAAPGLAEYLAEVEELLDRSVAGSSRCSSPRSVRRRSLPAASACGRC